MPETESEVIMEEYDLCPNENIVEETHDVEEQNIEKSDISVCNGEKLKTKLLYLFKYFMSRDASEHKCYWEMLPEKAVDSNPTNEVQILMDILAH